MTTHDATAERIAKRYGTTYRRIGVDIVTFAMAIEVESYDDVPDARGQLIGYTCSVFCAGADAAATRRALSYYASSDIGVMNSNGDILKASTR